MTQHALEGWMLGFIVLVTIVSGLATVAQIFGLH